MATKHDHHVVPQFYLRRFADQDKILRHSPKADGASKLIPVKHATVVKDLYTLDGADGTEDDGFENAFGLIESNAARALSAVLDQGIWPLPDRDRQRLALWFAAQYLRTPRSRVFLDSSMNEHRRQIANLTVDDLRAQLGDTGWSDEEIALKWSEVLHYYREDGVQPRNAHVGWFKNLVFEGASGIFMRPWHLMRFSEPSLLTSDCLVTPIREEGMLDPGMHLLSAPLVIVPLDRTNLMIMLPRRERVRAGDDGFVSGDEEMRVTANIMVAAHADQGTFEHPDDGIRARLPSWRE